MLLIFLICLCIVAFYYNVNMATSNSTDVAFSATKRFLQILLFVWVVFTLFTNDEKSPLTIEAELAFKGSMFAMCMAALYLFHMFKTSKKSKD